MRNAGKRGRLAEDAPSRQSDPSLLPCMPQHGVIRRQIDLLLEHSNSLERPRLRLASITQPWMAWLYSPLPCGRHYHIRYLQSCQGFGKLLQVELENMSAGPNMLVL